LRSPARRAVAARRTRALLLAAVLTAASVSSCSSQDDAPDPSLTAEPLGEASASSDARELARFHDQDVTWSSCREVMECAEVEVPLDYAEPDGETITLAMARVPATRQQQRVGALLVNPGGPGVSGIDYAEQAEYFFGDELRAAYDIVGFDPRGVGESTPIDCVDDEGLDQLLAGDPDPDTAAEVEQSRELLTMLGEGCAERSGELAAHVSTEDAARDMDVLRAVLDQDRLAYFGASYGTYLGATYADLFPERVGRLVLDGAIDPSVSSVEQGLVQAEGFEVALRAYVEHCVDEGDCFLGSSVDEGVETVGTLLEQLDEEPLPADGERDLTQGLGMYGIFMPLYSEESWTALDVGLQEALGGDGTTLRELADLYVSRGDDGYYDNSFEALYAVNCLDPGDEVSVEEAADLEDEFLEVSPTFGRIFAFGLTECTDWPVEGPEEQPVLDAPGAAPILVVGTTRDPATPLAWAESLAEQLSSGILVRRDGDGHTGYRAGNECVDSTVERYLVSGEVPDGTVDC
jgi:pimeloyl-ACP methyl ester carboxylesterase